MNIEESLRKRTFKLIQEGKKWQADPNHKACIWEDVDIGDGEIYFISGFPLMKTDTIEDAINKWMKHFKYEPVEYYKYLDIELNLLNERGMSKGGNLRAAAKLPETIVHLIRCFFPQYMTSAKDLMKIQRYLPKAFIGRMA